MDFKDFLLNESEGNEIAKQQILTSTAVIKCLSIVGIVDMVRQFLDSNNKVQVDVNFNGNNSTTRKIFNDGKQVGFANVIIIGAEDLYNSLSKALPHFNKITLTIGDDNTIRFEFSSSDSNYTKVSGVISSTENTFKLANAEEQIKF